MVALGFLAASGLPDHIIDGFLKLVDNDHVNARKGCNLLVYWVSANYDNKMEVFKCTPIIRALGYENLADKLEADRTVVTVRVHDDRVEAYVPEKYITDRNLIAIPGALRMTETNGTPKKQGRKIGYSFPLSELAHLETVLGVHHGGALACGTKGIYTIPFKRWADVMVFRQPQQAPIETSPLGSDPIEPALQSGIVHITVLPSGRLEIHSPYNAAFKDALKAGIPYQQRVWTGTCWVVSPNYRDLIKNLAQLHYGADI